MRYFVENLITGTSDIFSDMEAAQEFIKEEITEFNKEFSEDEHINDEHFEITEMENSCYFCGEDCGDSFYCSKECHDATYNERI